MLENRCDLHTHTIFSRHAYSTVRENVLAARDQGLELLGIADHFSDMIATGADLTHADLRDYQHYINVRCWPRVWEGVRLLHGAEADIRTLDGRLYGQDVPLEKDITADAFRHPTNLYDRVTFLCSYVIASVHYKGFTRGATPEQFTQMYIGALSQPKVLILGHIGRTGLPFDVNEVVGECARQHKLVEVNEHSFDTCAKGDKTYERIKLIARTCAELGCQIAINTDAHICCDVGRPSRALELLDEVGFPQELVATRSAEAFLAAMAAAGLEVPEF